MMQSLLIVEHTALGALGSAIPESSDTKTPLLRICADGMNLFTA
jgi:hypothetical protein